MNRFFRYAFALIALAAIACHGNTNELDTPTPPSGGDGGETTESGLVLSIDKQTIEADGTDAVTFSLTLDGAELMGNDATLSNVRIKHEVGDVKLDRYTTKFSAVKNGDYSFVATYKGQQSKNSVHVKARNREKYEPYGQKIVVYKITGTWCGYCPMMTAALKNVNQMWKNNMIVVAMHNGDRWSIPSSGGNDIAGSMLSRFGGTGLPSCVYDLSFLDSQRTPTAIDKLLYEQLRDVPATCGVKISQAMMLNGTLNISASIHSPKGGEYDLGYVVLLDNQYYTGGTATDNTYSDIAYAVSDNLMAMSDSRFTLAAGEELTKRFSVKNLPSDKVDNMRVMVFALSKSGGKTIVDNANVCAVGGTADYMAVEYVDGLPEGSGGSDVTPEGVLQISADKTTITADGTDAVTFTVNYGSQDVSNGSTMNLIYTFCGEQTELAAGANHFSTTAPGTYIFKARYYKAGDILSENEIVITATAPAQGEPQGFRHKMLGVQFTSVGCPNCPVLGNIISQIQREQPNRLVPVSFHLDYNISDPMKIAIAENYYNALEPNGLPRFYLDLRVGETMNSNKSVIDAEMAKTLANYPPTCGVAISTTYDASTRRLTITPRIQSNTATAYRYLVFLVEDGISHSQYGVTGSYTHNNVVRAVLSDNIYGARFNGGATLTAGVDTALSTSISTTLSSSWNAENMRVVCSVLTSLDGGVTYSCNNTNECPVGESVGYALEGEGDDNGGNEGGNTGGEVKHYNRHSAVFEFTGAWCSFCPTGYRFLQYLIEDYYSTDTVHVLAFHDSTGGNDPMGIPLTNTILNHFQSQFNVNLDFPAFVVDMREGTSDRSSLEGMLERTFKNYPATCGIRLENSCTADGKLSIKAELCASASDTYRIALYLLEDGIVAKQVDNGLTKENYVHNHVVRTMISSLYEGDRVGTLAAGESKSASYSLTLDSGWKAENCSVCALVIDGNGYVNNAAVCSLNGVTDFDYQK